MSFNLTFKGVYMKFIPVDNEILKNMVKGSPYIVVGVTDKDVLCLELEKDTNRKSTFILKIKNDKVAECQIRNMFDHVTKYVLHKNDDDPSYVLCFSENISIAKAISAIFADIYKIPRELYITDEDYRHVYSAFYDVATDLDLLPRM